MNTSTTRAECINMPLLDFIEYFESLADESERIKQQQKGGE